MVSGNGAEFFPVQSVDSTTPSTLCTGTSGYSGPDPDISVEPLIPNLTHFLPTEGLFWKLTAEIQS